ncbi:Ivy family c-type lysozyme inhibitor [Variovorax saccharolyticus]|uniref:Ivy family c-type lysozyme inhibitor n=1 Tax=Variovorax saccharolyticus TaxID=3053516 RepID=UPI002574FAFA|nr:Ivy family c-type lysozyme inhibitor [Variovorax sp. J31P216]MDM0023419.1 Ivy family c-type lysozyme inhibitor [Variovorax sp. J31P216]
MPRPSCLPILCIMAALQAPAWARDRLDADAIARFGGSYATECGNPAALRLRVLPDALLVERGSQRLVGRDPQASYSFLGPTPPKSFQVALLSQVNGKSELMFMVNRDRAGNYIQIEAAPELRPALAAALAGRKFRQCDGAATTAAANPPPASAALKPPAAAPGALPEHPSALLKDPAFRNAWRAALGAETREPWLATLNGPAPAPRRVSAAGGRFVLAAFCKPHDCYDNSAVLLYSAEGSRAYAYVHRVNRDILLGNPPPPVAAELRRLWQTEWRAPSR